MLQPFFITGLPRSGTAWLANWFTTNRTLCYHEPIQDLTALVRSHPGRRVGSSDSTLVHRYRELAEVFPDARWLYVDRPIGEVFGAITAVAAAAGMDLDRAQVKAQLEQDAAAGLAILHDAKRVAGVGFRDLVSDPDVAKAAWHWLLPEMRLDEERWKILAGLNVQQDVRLALQKRQEAGLIATPDSAEGRRVVEALKHKI